MIEIQHLNLTFGEGEKRNQVLDDVNISVREGEIYGLVGGVRFGQNHGAEMPCRAVYPLGGRAGD